MKRLTVVCLLVFVAATASAQTRAPWREGKPRIARLDLRGTITPSDIERDRFREFDLVVVSSRLETEQPGALNALQKANPDAIRLLIYSLADLWTDWRDHPEDGFVYQLGQRAALRRLWLPAAGGDVPGRDPAVNYWPGKHMTNVAHPDWPDTWAGVVARDLRAQESSQRGLLGVLADNAWDDPRWIENLPANRTDGRRIDANRDGAADPPDSLRTWWSTGTRRALSALRAELRPRVILANGPNTAYDEANGRMWENVGTEPWITVADILKEAAAFHGGEPRAHIVHVTPEYLDYGLAIALLRDDLYLAVSEEALLHSSRFWDERFNLTVGEPLGEATKSGSLWSRRYSNARVTVNEDSQTGTVTLLTPPPVD